MKNKNKVEHYIERYCKKLITKTVYSSRSTYYHFGHRIIRVSDHVAIKSDGCLSIILDSHDEEHFIVHAVYSGEISVVNYKELKEIIRTLRLLPAIVYVANQKPTEEPVILPTATRIDPTHVFGYPIGEFKPGHQEILRSILKNHIKSLKTKSNVQGLFKSSLKTEQTKV